MADKTRAQLERERDTAVRVAAEAMSMLSAEQLVELKGRLDFIDELARLPTACQE